MNRHHDLDCEPQLHNSTTRLQFSMIDTSRQPRRSSGPTTVMILLPLLIRPRQAPPLVITCNIAAFRVTSS